MNEILGTIAPQPSEDGQPGLHLRLEGYEINDEVEAVGLALIARHDRLGFLERVSIGWLLHHTDPPTSGGIHKYGSARLIPKPIRPFAKVDGIVTINARVWQVFEDRRREAIVLHELLHFGVGDSGALEIVPHDVEEFGFVARQYGAWSNALEVMGEQLRLGIAEAAG